jgi:AcrR family transcriptional regulator
MMHRTSAPAPKRKVKKTFIEEARRRQILDIALEEIALRGYQNTTVQEIAEKADITKGVIYYHFNGKEDLLSGIWSELVDELFEYRYFRAERHSSPKEKLRAYFEANFEFVENNLNKFAALFRMGIDIGAAVAKPNPWSREINRRCLDYLAGILREGQACGEFHQFSPYIIATIIQGAIDGLLLQGISDPTLYKLDTCKKMLCQIIERYTSPSPDDPKRRVR